VSEKYLAPVGPSLSDNAIGVLVPIVEEIAGWDSAKIRGWFEADRLVLQDWDKVHTDCVTIYRSVRAVPTGGMFDWIGLP
jgi:hypothetical protein